MKSKSHRDGARHGESNKVYYASPHDESLEMKYLNRNPYAADKDMAELYRYHRERAYDACMDHYRRCEKYKKR